MFKSSQIPFKSLKMSLKFPRFPLNCSRGKRVYNPSLVPFSAKHHLLASSILDVYIHDHTQYFREKWSPYGSRDKLALFVGSLWCTSPLTPLLIFQRLGLVVTMLERPGFSGWQTILQQLCLPVDHSQNIWDGIENLNSDTWSGSWMTSLGR